jgi:glycosyltransferase involved in cell wall biosynthesis
MAQHAAFRVIVCGQRFTRIPPVFDRARELLGDRLIHFGFADRSLYYDLLGSAHIAVSTAEHEFFGVSMIEAAHYGAYPLVPDRLAYPEVFPDLYRYRTLPELVERLADLCGRFVAGDDLSSSLAGSMRERFGPAVVAARFEALFESLAGRRVSA